MLLTSTFSLIPSRPRVYVASRLLHAQQFLCDDKDGSRRVKKCANQDVIDKVSESGAVLVDDYLLSRYAVLSARGIEGASRGQAYR